MTDKPVPQPFINELTQAVEARQGRSRAGSDELEFTCPRDGHEDRHPSARWNPGKATWFCPVCDVGGGAFALADLLGIEKPTTKGRRASAKQGEGARFTPSDTTATAQHPAGCTLAQYATAKGLDVNRLKGFGLSDIFYQGAPAVRFPFYGLTGQVISTQFRIRLDKVPDGDDRFRIKSGCKAVPYGQDRLVAARKRDYLVLVEGASDCHTLWMFDEPALGLPGASSWNEARDAALLDGIERIYIVVEPDQGGQTIMDWLSTSAIRDRAHLMELGAHEDPSGLYLDDPNRFPDRWAAAMAAAIPYGDVKAKEDRERTAEAWSACATLAHDDDILGRFGDAIEALGVVGARGTCQIIYLATCSRFLHRPVSVVVKGPSSGGKSYAVERVLEFFPDEAYYAQTGMSERALVYDDEPLVHRMFVVYEAAGMAGEMVSYFIRTLLSEGLIRYTTIEKTPEGLRPRHIERPGPTGLIVTTTAVHLHPENETRMLSVTVDDSREQTRRVMRSLASGVKLVIDMTAWHALQVWVAGQSHDVVIPYAAELAELMPDSAVRLRRDFGLVLNLIRTHAIIHQATRQSDRKGRVIATLQDYGVVRELVAGLLAEGLEATVPDTVRETVNTVKRLLAISHADEDEVPTLTISTIAKALKIDKSSASRRVKVAIDLEFLRNLETRRGRPAKIGEGDPMPENLAVLPTVEALRDRCAVADASGGMNYPASPFDDEEFVA